MNRWSIVAALVAGAAFAQGTEPSSVAASPAKPAALAQKSEQPPPLPPEVKKTVEAFLGHWKMEETLTLPGQKPVKFTAPFECKPIAARQAVYCSTAVKVPGMGPLEESAMVGYDAALQAVRFIVWNNVGETHDHHGRWTDEKTIEFEPLQASAMGKPSVEKISMTWSGPNEVRFVSETQQGSETVRFEGQGKRSGH